MLYLKYCLITLHYLPYFINIIQVAVALAIDVLVLEIGGLSALSIQALIADASHFFDSHKCAIRFANSVRSADVALDQTDTESLASIGVEKAVTHVSDRADRKSNFRNIE